MYIIAIKAIFLNICSKFSKKINTFPQQANSFNLIDNWCCWFLLVEIIWKSLYRSTLTVPNLYAAHDRPWTPDTFWFSSCPKRKWKWFYALTKTRKPANECKSLPRQQISIKLPKNKGEQGWNESNGFRPPSFYYLFIAFPRLTWDGKKHRKLTKRIEIANKICIGCEHGYMAWKLAGNLI